MLRPYGASIKHLQLHYLFKMTRADKIETSHRIRQIRLPEIDYSIFHNNSRGGQKLASY